MSKIANLESQVTILKTKAAANKGLGASVDETESVWPVPQFGESMKIDNVTDGSGADGSIIPAGSMFPLGCAIPNKTVLEHGMYFPPGTMFPDGVLVPIHARMVSVQPLQNFKLGKPVPEPACLVM